MFDRTAKTVWKGPTIKEIAEIAGVGTATVDRVLNNRVQVREKTRQQVMEALDKLSFEGQAGDRHLDIRLFCESGETFNNQMAAAADAANRVVAGAVVRARFETTDANDPSEFAEQIEADGARSDGVVLVAREHPAINRVARKLVGAGIPVVCLTTDLPSSRRSAYIGNDQYAAGCVAAQLIGRALPPQQSRILLVMSVAFRSQQEREMGFRRVLRADFPHLRIEDRLTSNDVPEQAFEQVDRYIKSQGPPAAIYNVAGANRGVAKALEMCGSSTATLFVGHELTPRSRSLLEAGQMDYVISHDFEREVETSMRWIAEFHHDVRVEPAHSPILVHTRYNCET